MATSQNSTPITRCPLDKSLKSKTFMKHPNRETKITFLEEYVWSALLHGFLSVQQDYRQDSGMG